MPQDIKLQKAEDGKGLSTHDYTEEAKAKVDAIPENPKYTDTVYTHPESHPASMITQDSARRMVSDTQITAWTNKVDKSGGEMTGALMAKSSGNTRQVRNIAIGSAAPTSTAGYSEGDLFLVVP